MSVPSLTRHLLDAGRFGPGLQGAEVLRALLADAPHPRCEEAAGVAVSLARLGAVLGEVAPFDGMPADIARSVAARRLSFVAGRLCAEQALRRLGIVAAVGRGAEREPLWPAGVIGAITHTGVTACAMVARAEGETNDGRGQVADLTPPAPSAAGRRYGLGIDSQTLADAASVEAILSVCCTPDERAALARQFSQGHDGLAATIVFALKEAFYKAVHPTVRRFVDFDELAIDAIDLASGRAALHPSLPELPPGAPIEGRFTIVDGEVHALVELHRA